MSLPNFAAIQSLFESVLKGYQGGLGVDQATQKEGIAGSARGEIVFEAHPLFGDISERMVRDLMTQKMMTRKRVLQFLKDTSSQDVVPSDR
jgi:hypothetical protein